VYRKKLIILQKLPGRHPVSHGEGTGMTDESKLPIVLLLMLMTIVILLMVVIVGLFLRMNQLQQEVLAALQPLQAMHESDGRPRGLEVGEKAPDFRLLDTKGQIIALEDFTGQKVLLTFSSVRCPVCTERYPELRFFSEQHRSVQVVMISMGSLEENQQLVEEQGLSFPILMWEDAVAREYQVPGTPFFYVIDEEGVIVNADFANTLEQLEALVEGSAE